MAQRAPTRQAPEGPAGRAALTRLAYRHQRVQRLRRLMGRRSVRVAESCFVVEGAKVLGEAVAAGAPVESVYLGPEAGEEERALARRCSEAGLRVFDLEAGVLERVAATVNPQPLLAVVRRVDIAFDTLAGRHPTLVVVCVEVRDPGNAGTILRSAEAAGSDGVIFCEGTVDLFNPKTVRASAGALFHVPVALAAGAAAETLALVGEWGLVRLGLVASGGEGYDSADLTQPLAIVVGNEANGLAPELRSTLDRCLSIPMPGRAESLNVSMAATVMCFEAARQRRARDTAAPAAGAAWGQR